jgi:hypothetical protein
VSYHQPTVEEELERKVSERLHLTLKHLSQGAVTKDYAEGVLDALWGASSGLVTKDLMELMSNAIEAVSETEAQQRMRVFAKEKRVMILTIPDQMKVSCELIEIYPDFAPKYRSLTSEDDTLQDAMEKLNKTAEALLQRNFMEIK